MLSITQTRYFGDVQVTVLSGAGISAESGVPTFRDVETGLWAKVDPYEISSAQGWQPAPGEGVGVVPVAALHDGARSQPNNGHLAVAAWQDYADVHVVTQNVDNLHERAGSKHVYHLHGSLFEFRCDRCQCAYDDELPAMPEPVDGRRLRRGAACGGLIRPNVVWFGEPLPDDAWQRSVEAVSSADVVIVVGTSSIVYPAAGLPELALANGTVVIEVNPERTPLSDSATVTLRETAAGALPACCSGCPAMLG